MKEFSLVSPIGVIKLVVHNGSLVYCCPETKDCESKYNKIIGKIGPSCNISDEDDLLIHEVIRQLNEYFRRERKTFDLPIKISDTNFREKVWSEMAKIPYGETSTYGELARRIGEKKAVRAVASACGANPISIILPCHRVVSSAGLGGFTGGIDKKTVLLNLEKSL